MATTRAPPAIARSQVSAVLEKTWGTQRTFTRVRRLPLHGAAAHRLDGLSPPSTTWSATCHDSELFRTRVPTLDCRQAADTYGCSTRLLKRENVEQALVLLGVRIGAAE